MMRKLTQLRIDEVSAVIKGANEGAKVMIRKHDQISDPPYLFNDIMKLRNDDDEQRTNTIPDDDKVSAKLRSMVAALIMSNPTFSKEEATHYLLHTAHGRRLAEHFNNISKHEDEIPMNRSEEMQEMCKFVKSGGMSTVAKRIIETGSTSLTEPEYTELVLEDAALRKVSFEKAFAGPTTQQAYKIVREVGHLKSLVAIAPGSYDAIIKGMATLKPTSTSVGNTLVPDDSAEAVRLLAEMAERQHRTFEQIFSDPANAKLAARTYTSAHRSSVVYTAEEDA
jgi:hypothetical protein